MSRSFASSPLQPRRRLVGASLDRRPPLTGGRRASTGAVSAVLLALTLLTTGCGAKNAHYSAAEIQSAFAAEHIALYGPGQPFPDRFSRDRGALALAPAPSLATPSQPLPALLKGIRDAVFIPSLSGHQRTVTLRGSLILVFVYPTVKQAQARAAGYADIIEAEQILQHRVEVGYMRRGNVVVSYRTPRSQRGVPGFDDPRVFDRDFKRRIAAALSHLP